MIPIKTIEELVSKHSTLEKDLSSGKIDKKLLRPSKTLTLRANTSKARSKIKFKAKIKIKDLIKIMMDHELSKYKN